MNQICCTMCKSMINYFFLQTALQGSTGLPKAVVHSNHTLMNMNYSDGLCRGHVDGYVQTWVSGCI